MNGVFTEVHTIISGKVLRTDTGCLYDMYSGVFVHTEKRFMEKSKKGMSALFIPLLNSRRAPSSDEVTESARFMLSGELHR